MDVEIVDTYKPVPIGTVCTFCIRSNKRSNLRQFTLWNLPYLTKKCWFMVDFGFQWLIFINP